VGSDIKSEDLAEYFVETFREQDYFSQGMRSVWKDYLIDRRNRDPNFSSGEPFDARDQEDYDWSALKNDFRIYLEKRLDRNNQNLENPDYEDGLERDHFHRLGYVDVGPEFNGEDVFMTSIVHFQDPEEPDWAVYAEYLDENESINAVTHLLERRQQEEVKNLIERNLETPRQDKALKVYAAIVETDIGLAKEILSNTEDLELETSMRKEIFNHANVFDRFGNELDF